MLEPRPSQVERQRWCLFRCRRPPANEDIWGKKWVTLTDPAGTRCAHALRLVPLPHTCNTKGDIWDRSAHQSSSSSVVCLSLLV